MRVFLQVDHNPLELFIADKSGSSRKCFPNCTRLGWSGRLLWRTRTRVHHPVLPP